MPSAGLNFTALSSRFSTARSSATGSPIRYHGCRSTSKCTSAARRFARASACSTTSTMSTCSCVDVRRVLARELDQVADQLGQLVELGAQVGVDLRSVLFGQSGGVSGFSAASSSSRLVRSEVSGVRSSCPASATSWRWRS